MTARTVYVNGAQPLWRTPQPESVFIGHDYFGEDALRRNDYRLPFRDAFAADGYRLLFPDELALPGVFLSTLTQQILDAGASIFDVTDCNANVLIELGLALGMNLPVLTVCESANSSLPDFLEELAPLRFASRPALARAVVGALRERVRAYGDGRLSPRYCAACQLECASRQDGPLSVEDYVVVGVSAQEDEELRWNVEETLKDFQPPPHEEMLEGNQTICQWMTRLRHAKVALFHVREPHHGPETASVYLQLGLAAGLGVPWAMIVRERENPPADLRGLAYVTRGERDILFRTALSNAVRGLLLASRVAGGPMATPLPHLDDDEVEEDPKLANSPEVTYAPDTQQYYQIPDEQWAVISARVRGILSRAREEALRAGREAVGTEHLLLELMAAGSSDVAKMLSDLGSEAETLRAAIESAIGRGEGDKGASGDAPSAPGPTQHAQSAITRAITEARGIGKGEVDGEYLLLGLANSGASAQVLTQSGVTLRGVLAVLRGERPPSATDSDLFAPFTERARKVLSLAQEEAQRFNHNYIGTEHLLLGLVREGDGVAAKVLANLGVELNKVRSAVEFIIGRGDRIVLGDIGLTPRAKKVIELAVDEARRLNHHYIGTEHLLLGLVREGEGIAAGVLESLGVNLEKARMETMAMAAAAD